MTRQPNTNVSSTAGLAALLLIQIAVGYEWLVSGLTKIVHGDFPSGLSAQLAEMSKQSPAWYRTFLTDAVTPHAATFGYAIEYAELLVGLVFAGTAVVLLYSSGESLHRRRALQLASSAAALVGIVLAINFELINGGHFGMRLASDSFNEGVDLETILIALQLALLAFSVAALPRRRSREPPADQRAGGRS